jgi:hypothetical protein
MHALPAAVMYARSRMRVCVAFEEPRVEPVLRRHRDSSEAHPTSQSPTQILDHGRLQRLAT